MRMSTIAAALSLGFINSIPIHNHYGSGSYPMPSAQANKTIASTNKTNQRIRRKRARWTNKY